MSYIIPSYPGPASDLCLVLVTPDRDKFFELSECKKMVVQVYARFATLSIYSICKLQGHCFYYRKQLESICIP